MYSIYSVIYQIQIKFHLLEGNSIVTAVEDINFVDRIIGGRIQISLSDTTRSNNKISKSIFILNS